MERAMHTPTFNGSSILAIGLNVMAVIFLDISRYSNLSNLAAFFAIVASISTIAVNLKNWIKRKKI